MDSNNFVGRNLGLYAFALNAPHGRTRSNASRSRVCPYRRLYDASAQWVAGARHASPLQPRCSVFNTKAYCGRCRGRHRSGGESEGVGGPWMRTRMVLFSGVVLHPGPIPTAVVTVAARRVRGARAPTSQPCMAALAASVRGHRSRASQGALPHSPSPVPSGHGAPGGLRRACRRLARSEGMGTFPGRAPGVVPSRGQAAEFLRLGALVVRGRAMALWLHS